MLPRLLPVVTLPNVANYNSSQRRSRKLPPKFGAIAAKSNQSPAPAVAALHARKESVACIFVRSARASGDDLSGRQLSPVADAARQRSSAPCSWRRRPEPVLESALDRWVPCTCSMLPLQQMACIYLNGWA